MTGACVIIDMIGMLVLVYIIWPTLFSGLDSQTGLTDWIHVDKMNDCKIQVVMMIAISTQARQG